MAQKWEYFATSRPMDMRLGITDFPMTYEEFLEHLNDFGEDGWEIISTTPVERKGDLPWVEYLFKRPLED